MADNNGIMNDESNPRAPGGILMLLRTARFVSGAGLIAAVFYSLLFGFTFSNRLRIQHNRDLYRHEVFEVQDAVYHPRSGEDSESYWFKGVVAGNQERFIPEFAEGADVECREDLLSLYPAGTKLNVLYNPRETETIIQGETLRVLHYFPGFWEKEERLRSQLFRVVAIPAPLALCFYLAFRSLHKRTLSSHLLENDRIG
jgi:hypothetical protein